MWVQQSALSSGRELSVLSAGDDQRHPRIAVKVDSAWHLTWSVECLSCRRTLGDSIAGQDADAVARLATGHRCPSRDPAAEGLA